MQSSAGLWTTLRKLPPRLADAMHREAQQCPPLFGHRDLPKPLGKDYASRVFCRDGKRVAEGTNGMKFHVTIDFPDDLWQASGEWTEGALRQLVRGYAERGISAVHWIDYGNRADGLWEAGSYLDRKETAAPFIERVPNPLTVVVDEAHKHGLRAYSVLKAFDLCFAMPWASYPLGKGPGPPVGLPHVGGEGNWAIRWLRERPELRACLHPSLHEGDEPRWPIRTIRLWHEDDGLSEAPPIRIFVSADNGTYRPYSGPMDVRFGSRIRRPPVFTPAPEQALGNEGVFSCLGLSGLEIPEPFVCLEPTKPWALANTLQALVEVEDAAGQVVRFTYGLIPRQVPRGRWREVGIAFDAAYQTPVPGRGWTWVRSGGRTRVELAELGLVGIARGRNEYLTGVVELAYPEARAYLVGMVQNAVEAGVDGVDLRFSTHTESLDWENYGFGPPIIEEFKQRHGVDIDTEPFDRALWRRLR